MSEYNVNSPYYCDDTNVFTEWSTRHYWKTNAGPAYCFAVGFSTDTEVMVVSKTENYAYYTTDHGQPTYEEGTFTFQNETWYYKRGWGYSGFNYTMPRFIDVHNVFSSFPSTFEQVALYCTTVASTESGIYLLASQVYLSSPIETTTLTLNNLSKYRYLLAVIGDWSGSQYSRAQWIGRTYLNQGTEIGYSIYNNTSSCMTRTYQIPVTADSMTLTGSMYHYQIYGIAGCEIELIDSLTTEHAAENLITSFPLTNISKYSEILFINDANYGTYADESLIRSDLYINEGTEIGYSGARSSISHLSISTRLPVSGSSMTVTGHMYYYQVFGLYSNQHIKAAGSAEAIRDWFNASFYNKEEIENLFIQNNQTNLTPYDITIISDTPDRFIKLEGLDSGKIYNICISALMGDDSNE